MPSYTHEMANYILTIDSVTSVHPMYNVNIKILVCQIIGPAAAGSAGHVFAPVRQPSLPPPLGCESSSRRGKHRPCLGDVDRWDWPVRYRVVRRELSHVAEQRNCFHIMHARRCRAIVLSVGHRPSDRGHLATPPQKRTRPHPTAPDHRRPQQDS